MHSDDTAIDAWLGPALDDLTDDQRTRFTAAWDRAATVYPDPDDQDERDAYLSAAVQYLLGDTTPRQAGVALTAANTAVTAAKAGARAVAALAIEDGASEYQLHQDLRVTRRTLRLWLGKTS